MKSVLYLVVALVVMSLAFWAYRENYRTQDALNEMESVQKEIASLREQLLVLSAEWDYLNRPARLRELVRLNADRLELEPITSDQFVDTSNIDYPPPPVRYPPRRPEDFVPPTEGAITDADPTPSEAEAADRPPRQEPQ
ncbi:cell division protein FtsL [Paracoccus aerodenitrificans]|uniref:cell division protein FtsL n=1 Tax=Paracoccus aerodenitrificans TaxID=3017781 RepID=UPI0022F00045|nr:cell division protein FtsL [Paracoccus aerodenitrificans]WBU63148.1 cell division protein FtsL [Paracoccus aerodenitrificans]